jgi:hypothetical protein
MSRLIVISAVCFVTSLLAGTANAQSSGPAAKGSGTAGANASATPAQVHRRLQRQSALRQPTALPMAKSTNNVRLSYSDAVKRYRHERHDRIWWKQHFTTIVLVGGGYYYFNAGYWFPAWGYNPVYEFYDYDGPIFTYGNLLPDQVILNVQRALADLGYYNGALSGSLSAATRYAISAYQQDNGLVVNGVVDAPLVYSLGLQ